MQVKVMYEESNNKYLIIACIVFLASLYGIGNVYFIGQENSYGVSREVPLGILLIGYAFFVGISVGLSVVATLSHVFKYEAFHVRSKHIALLSFASLIGAFFLIFWELGGPFQLQVLRFVKYYTNFELSSPIWWMSTFYLFETPLLALEVYFLLKRNEKATFYAGIVGFFLGLIAFSTLSMVFAVNVAKPLWHSAQFTISFVVGALICGVGVTILLIYSRKSKEPNRDENIIALSKMLGFLLVISAAIVAWTEIISYYGPNLLGDTIRLVMHKALKYNYFILEIAIGIILPLILLLIGKFRSLFLTSLASLCAIIGVFFGRYDAVIGGQLIKVESVYFPNLELAYYSPSLSEISIFIGAIGLVMIIYELGNKFLPMSEI